MVAKSQANTGEDTSNMKNDISMLSEKSINKFAQIISNG